MYIKKCYETLAVQMGISLNNTLEYITGSYQDIVYYNDTGMLPVHVPKIGNDVGYRSTQTGGIS